MDYTIVGGAKASRVVMGCMRIADKSLSEVEKLVTDAISVGVNAFDHADIYGGGNCEKIFGVAMKDLKIARDSYLVQTKCGIRKFDGGRTFDFSKEHIIRSAEDSLRRLNTEYVDMFLLHRPDTLMDADEIGEAFGRLKASGKVRAFGVSNFSALQMEYLRKNGVEVSVDQMQFSLGHTLLVDAGLNVNMKTEAGTNFAGDTLDYARLNGIPLQAWSPLQYGFFEGVFIGNEKFPALNQKLNEIAEKYEATPTAIACAWILRHPVFKQVVTGTTSPARMKEMSKGADITLTKKEWYDLYLSAGKTMP